jgi:FtsP/CotA-like multicopper oxidase with cupredoxin domain
MDSSGMGGVMGQPGMPLQQDWPALFFWLLIVAGSVLLLTWVGRRFVGGLGRPAMRTRQLDLWAAGLSVAAGLLHLVAAPEHLSEWWGYGYFFLASGIGQVLYGQFLFLDSRRSQRFYLVGLVGTLGVIVVYVVSRTIGIPLFGPGAGEVEPVGALDVPSKLVELAVVAVLATVLGRSGTTEAPAHHSVGQDVAEPRLPRRDEPAVRFSRRTLVAGLAGGSLGLAGLVASARGLQPLAILPRPDSLPPTITALLPGKRTAAIPLPWAGKSTGNIREFKLTVSRIQWPVAPGHVVGAYAYNGQVPGPELRVTEGDTVRVTVTNTLDEPTTIHWHGVEVPATMDGVPGLSQDPIPPGGTFVYEFIATPSGTRWYHSHFDEVTQPGNGLAGALIIEPHNPPIPRPDREYVIVAGQLIQGGGQVVPSATSPAGASGGMGGSSTGTGGMMGGTGGMMGGTGGMMGGGTTTSSRLAQNSVFAVNGKTYPNVSPLVVKEGERVKLRLINAGATESATFALAGHRLTVTHSDGNPLAEPVEAEAVRLGVGERLDAEFVANQPGRWQLRGFVPDQEAAGLAVDVIYGGHEADPSQATLRGSLHQVVTNRDFAGPPHPTPPDRTYDLTVSGGMMGSADWTINGKSYPNTDPLNVQDGDRVRVKLFSMSMEDHPMHLHGHTFQVVVDEGRPVDGPLKDTLTVRPMESYEIEFVANNPGRWLFHCHNLAHMTGGLMTEVHYV